MKERSKDGKKIDLVKRLNELEEIHNPKNVLSGLKIGVDQVQKFENAKVGDRVELGRGKMGTIRYIGQVKFNSSEEVIGIELDKFDAQAHDGRGYFETKKGHGYAIFKTKDDIERLIPMSGLKTPKGMKGRWSSTEAYGGIAPNNIQIDDRVRLQNGRTGVIRWKGKFDAEPVVVAEETKEPAESKGATTMTASSDGTANRGDCGGMVVVIVVGWS